MVPDSRRLQLNEELARLGRALVAQLFVLFKTSLNYAEGHAALEAPVENALRVVRDIEQIQQDVSLGMRGDHLFLGELRIRPDSAGFEAFRFVMEEMRRHRVGRISLNAETTQDDLRRFVYAFRDTDDVQGSDPFASMLERMQRRMICNVEVATLSLEVETVEVGRERLKDEKHKARTLYRKAVGIMEDLMLDASVGHTLRLRESKRVVQQVIDLLSSDEAYLIGLTTMRCHESYTQNHPMNVCILSLAVGRRLGLSKFHLCELGMAALFHDIGKGDLPREILDKEGELSEQEQRLVEEHPLLGVKKMMRLKGLDSLSSRMVAAAFEHHLLADFTGYPRLPYRKLGLFARIISMADSYDALTSSKVAGRTPFPPDKALRFLLAQGGKAYDAPLLKLLINCLGMHCIGTLVLLNTKELAVVVANPSDPGDWDHPRVRIIADAMGHEQEDELVVDLADSAPPRSIMATLDASHFGLDVSRYFL